MQEWFGVRSVYEIRAVGIPKKTDKDFNPDILMFEDRIVIFKAKDFESALKKARIEAERYISQVYKNIYFQKLIKKRLKRFNAFRIFDEPGDGKELYSTTRLIKGPLTYKQAENLFFGKDENAKQHRQRKKFLDRDFMAPIK